MTDIKTPNTQEIINQLTALHLRKSSKKELIEAEDSLVQSLRTLGYAHLEALKTLTNLESDIVFKIDQLQAIRQKLGAI